MPRKPSFAHIQAKIKRGEALERDRKRKEMEAKKIAEEKTPRTCEVCGKTRLCKMIRTQWICGPCRHDYAVQRAEEKKARERKRMIAMLMHKLVFEDGSDEAKEILALSMLLAGLTADDAREIANRERVNTQEELDALWKVFRQHDLISDNYADLDPLGMTLEDDNDDEGQ